MEVRNVEETNDSAGNGSGIDGLVMSKLKGRERTDKRG